jgi:hypothetical protein
MEWEIFWQLFRWVRPIVRSGVKVLGRETLRTGGNILSDIAENKPTASLVARDIVSKRLNESRQNLINKLSCLGRKRKRPAKSKRKPPKKAKMTKKGHLFLNFISRGLAMPEDTDILTVVNSIFSRTDRFRRRFSRRSKQSTNLLPPWNRAIWNF